MSAIHFSLGPNRANLHRSHLSNREIHEGEANKHNEERPYHSGSSTIGQNARKGRKKDLPCCDQGTRKTDHGGKLEVSLEDMLKFCIMRCGQRVSQYSLETYAQLLNSS